MKAGAGCSDEVIAGDHRRPGMLQPRHAGGRGLVNCVPLDSALP